VSEPRLTRRGLVGAAVALPFLAKTATAWPGLAVRKAATRSTLVLSAAELEAVRGNIFDRKLPFAVRAWSNTLGKANGELHRQASPTDPRGDLSDWFEKIYHPGLLDGDAAYNLGLAYLLTGDEDFGRAAKGICLAWAQTYRPLPPPNKVGHLVAEPVGPVIKLCMAFSLVRPLCTAGERSTFVSWAALFVNRAMQNADSARDFPWVPDVTYGSDVSNVAPYGNSATWQRAMAVWSAAIVGGNTLKRALAWNYSHTTSRGRPYGWDEMLEGLIIDGAGGQVVEDRYRNSIEYGHFSWTPLVFIADLARRVRSSYDLFAYATRAHKYTVFTPVAYYGRFLTQESVPGSLEQTQYGGSQWSSTASRWRSVYEVLYRNASDRKLAAQLARIVGYGGPTRRGDNYDIYTINYGALLGRGPKGPMPAAPKPKPKPKPK
jgi:hypothetical protein